MNDEDLKNIANLLDKKLEPVNQKLDALTADVINLQDQVGAIWDRVSMDSDNNSKDIKQIKKHLNMPLSTD